MKKFIKLLAVALAAAALAGCSLVSINTEKITVATVGEDTITKAAEIHDNPDVTDLIAASLAADTAEHDELMQQVQALAETEANVRERTRDSRVKFIGAIAAVIVVIVIIAAIWFALT